MNQPKDDDQPATRGDVRQIVGEVVGDIVGAALQLTAEQFDKVRADLKDKASKADIVRLENKLDPTIDSVDNLKTKWRQQFGSI